MQYLPFWDKWDGPLNQRVTVSAVLTMGFSHARCPRGNRT